jgi:hypothetical protein
VKHNPSEFVQFIVIGPVRDPKALAAAFASLETLPRSESTADEGTTARIPTTNIRIYSRSDGSRDVEVIAPNGKAELHLTPEEIVIQ